jgi:hypothetical protein
MERIVRIGIRLLFPRHFYTIVFRPTIPFGRVKVHARTPEAQKEHGIQIKFQIESEKSIC